MSPITIRICKFLLKLALTGFLVFSGGLYFLQEQLLLHPTPIPHDYTFRFDFSYEFQEREFQPEPGVSIHGLHFKLPNPKGVVTAHWGNGGNVLSVALVAPTFLKHGYDFLVTDYRGFGKSRGPISEHALFSDAQHVYDSMKAEYTESTIVIVGASFGSGIAAYLAGHNNPKFTLLISPYYSMIDLASNYYPFVPVSLLLKYPLRSDLYLQQSRSPVHLVHGKIDNVIYYESSVKLHKLLGPRSKFLTLPKTGHGDIFEQPPFQTMMAELLS